MLSFCKFFVIHLNDRLIISNTCLILHPSNLNIMDWNEKQLHILSVAEALFASKGFEGTSVRDIAQAAEINVAMISYYFGSKEKLLYGLIEERAERSSLMLKKLNKNKTMSPWEKMEYIIDFYVDTMLKNRDYHTIASRQLSIVQDEPLAQLLVNIKRRNSALIIEIINEGKQKGVFKEVDNELTIGTVMGTISNLSMSRLFYCSQLEIPANDEEKYYRILKPRLKKHLKQLLGAHLNKTLSK